MKKLLLATAAMPLLAGGVAQAQPVNGLYVGAGAGVNMLQNTDVSTGPALTRGLTAAGGSGGGKLTFETGYALVGSIGWGFGNGLRAEVEGSFRENEVGTMRGFGLAPFRGVSGAQRSYGAMANVLYDFDLRPWGINWMQPYVGVGAGYMWTDFYNARGTSGASNTRLTINDSDGQFAYQGILGVAFPINSVPGLALTAEYRFLGTLQPTQVAQLRNASNNAVISRGNFETDNYNHSLMVGVRYAFGAAPPPPPAAPAVAPAPARTYLVFFDWDRYNLTDRARGIIAEAAQNRGRVQVTRIEVNGYTDRSGTPQYNLGLSNRRANAVAAELVRLGVPQNEIVTRGFGEENPLVPTADGVREPQNRRVEIILR